MPIRIIKLQRAEKKGDRSRHRISTPSEQMLATFNDGMVTVETQREGTAKALERKGWTRIPQATSYGAAIVDAIKERTDGALPVFSVSVDHMTSKELKALARKRDLAGRGSMSKAELRKALQ